MTRVLDLPVIVVANQPPEARWVIVHAWLTAGLAQIVDEDRPWLTVVGWVRTQLGNYGLNGDSDLISDALQLLAAPSRLPVEYDRIVEQLAKVTP